MRSAECGTLKPHLNDGNWSDHCSRLTDPAFAGSAAFADYGAPEALSLKHYQTASRDVGLAESGFALPATGVFVSPFPISQFQLCSSCWTLMNSSSVPGAASDTAQQSRPLTFQ